MNVSFIEMHACCTMLKHIVFLLLSITFTNAQTVADCVDGRNTIVQYLGWKWVDIEHECERANNSMCAIQVPPPFEHEKITLDQGSDPWYQRWSIVGYYYRVTDSGMDLEFDSMVSRCNEIGIRVFIDVEVNHMTPDGNEGGCFGSAGSWYDARDDAYYYLPTYSTVPWSRNDFHLANDANEGCPTSSGRIENVSDPEHIWRCKLHHNKAAYDTDGYYNDIKSDGPDYVNQLTKRMDISIDKGVYGFKFSHARWVRPSHLDLVAKGTKDVPGSGKPFFYSETVDFKDGIVSAEDYTGFGRIEEVMAGHYLSEMARRDRPLTDFESWGVSGGAFNMVESSKAIVYVDDPNRQRGVFRDAAGQSYPVVTFRDSREYVVANSLMLSHPYGMKKVLSSFDWEQDIVGDEDKNDWQGPPMTDGIVDDVVVSSDGFSCEGAWNCEHRWQSIKGMMIFENTIKYILSQNADFVDDITNFQSRTDYQIAFTRGEPALGFFAINNDELEDVSDILQTGLPEGRYCDLTTMLDFSDIYECSDPTERVVEVDNSGFATINIPANDAFPAIAIVL